MRSGFIQLIIVLLLLITIFCIGFLYVKNQNFQEKLVSQNATIDQLKEQIDVLRGYRKTSHEPSPLPTDRDFRLKSKPKLELTKNWKVYKNTDFGFEVKVPSSWDVPYIGGDFFPQGNLKIFTAEEKSRGVSKASFGIGNPIKTTDDINAWYGNDLTNETINGMEFQTKFVESEECGTAYYIKRGDYIFVFALTTFCDKGAVEQYDQILVNIINTLKFTN